MSHEDTLLIVRAIQSVAFSVVCVSFVLIVGIFLREYRR